MPLEGRKALKKLFSATKQGLSAGGILGAVMGVSDRRRGQADFREPEGLGEMVATQALRGICGDDRVALRWDCRICQGREQGLAECRGWAEPKRRVIQRRAYGLRDEEYLRLLVLTYMLKPYEKQTTSTYPLWR